MTAEFPTGRRPLVRAFAGLLGACLTVSGAAIPDVRAQVGWEPFPEPETKRPARNRAATPPATDSDRPTLPPMNGQWSAPGANPDRARTTPEADGRRDTMIREPLPPLDEKSRSVDRGDLQPVMAGDGSGLPLELWRGLDTPKVEVLFAALEIPPRSPALAALWRRLITSDATPPTGPATGLGGDGHFAALRVEALTRSGLLKEAGEAVARMPGGQTGGAADALAAILTARNEIALGRRDTACEAVRAAPASASVPKALKTETILISGYCAVSGGNTAAAGLTADLAREHGAEASAGLAALDALATGSKPDLRNVKSLSPVEFRLIALAGSADLGLAIDKGTPATVAAIALDPQTDTSLRLKAGEAALKLNAIAPADLATIYRSQRTSAAADALPPDSSGNKLADVERRAGLFNAAEAERTPLKKVRLIRSFLDDARRAALYLPALEMMSAAADAVTPVAEVGWFAETAIEVALAAGQHDRARTWVRFAASVDRAQPADGRGPLDHWLALSDISEKKPPGPRGVSLASVEDLALRGRFGVGRSASSGDRARRARYQRADPALGSRQPHAAAVGRTSAGDRRAG